MSSGTPRFDARAFVLAAALVAGCGDRDRPAAPPAPAPPGARAAEPVQAATPKPVPKAAPSPEHALTRAELQALLDAWLRAQNEGDFAAYAALYAPDMTGIKRVGKRESRMDLEAWLADRERMFQKPMEVAVSEVGFTTRGGRAFVDFVQTFRQGSFVDSGPKRITVVERAAQPRIVHEEMLLSNVAVPASALARRAHVVLRANDASYVLLEDRADPSWGAGRFARVGDAGFRQLADDSRVPDGAARRALRFDVYDAKGGSCSTGLERLELLLLGDGFGALVDPDDPTEARFFDGSHDDADDEVDAMARVVLRTQTPLLAGKLAACKEGFAVPAGTPRPPMQLELTDAALGARVLGRARELSHYREAQARWERMWREAYEGEPAPSRGPGPWAEGSASVFGDGAEARFALATFSSSGCGLELAADVTALYSIEPGGELRLISAAASFASATVLADLDGNGVPELLDLGWGAYTQRFYAASPGGFYTFRHVPYFWGHCGC